MKINEPTRLNIAEPEHLQKTKAEQIVPAKPTLEKDGKTAIIVCHGMGQQVKFQPLSMITDLILKKSGSKALPENVKIQKFDNASIPQVEIKLTEGNTTKEIHLFEVYWAPITEGRIKLTDVIKFLFESGWEGLRYTILGKFRRWAFGSLRVFKFPRLRTFLSLFIVVLLLTASAVLFIHFSLFISTRLLSAYFDFFTVVRNQTLLNSVFSYFGHLAGLISAKPISLVYFLSYLLVVWIFYKLKYVLIQFPGDVAAYISAHKLNKFYEVREQIKQKAIETAKAVFFSVNKENNSFLYSDIIIAGHSLGSVIAYDMLNGVINEDKIDNEIYLAVKRTKLLVTFGSPLDKTAFLFRTHVKGESETREALAAAMQPLILSYDNRTFKWINVWSPFDIFSGKLNYYDNPDEKNNNSVENQIDWKAWIPLASHNQYWKTELVMNAIYNGIFK